MEDHEGGGLVGLLLGIGLGVWATVGHGGIGVGLLSILVIVASVAWLSTSAL